MLNLCAAFDKMDHQILVKRLSNVFGVKHDALVLVESYLPIGNKQLLLMGLNRKIKP